MKMLRCKADAEDVVQETFIKWLSAEQEKIKNTRAYLITSVRNNCINHLKALQKKKDTYLDSWHWPEFVEKFKETDFSAIDIEEKLSSALHVLQEKLEPLERAVYVLREAFDFDYKSLQDTLNKKQDHCRQLLSRAKKKLNDEKESLNEVLRPHRSALNEYFDKACMDFNFTELISQLKRDKSES